jgi:signal peptidase I
MASSKKKQEGGTKETIQSIVIALIIAFVFRTFVLEAFVIPTGSMATTLLGAHVRLTCSDCGWAYDVNVGGQAGPGGEMQIDRQSAAVSAICPNCGFRENPRPREIYYGDRILVQKYAHLLRPPSRWDVTVFKSPADPHKTAYQVNYIKRLVGLPGERLMLLDGDVFVTRAERPADSDWEVQEKPDAVQKVLWRIVHDFDHAVSPVDPARDRERSPVMLEALSPWKIAGSGIVLERDQTGARGFTLQPSAEESLLRFDPAVAPAKRALTDWLAYDQHQYDQGPGRMHPVGDLKLSLLYEPRGGEGELRLHLAKRQDLFIAVISQGAVALYHQEGEHEAGRQLLMRKSVKLPQRPMRLDFINLDYRVRLLVDGQELLTSTAAQYRPDIAALREAEARRSPLPHAAAYITGREVSGRITHLSLWRDIYYIADDALGRIVRGTWRNPAVLGADEYFMLGDNSALSQDGRYWEDPIDLPAEGLEVAGGLVPGRFLLGRAVFVYWPAGFRPFAASPLDLVPNFGQMRFIH